MTVQHLTGATEPTIATAPRKAIGNEEASLKIRAEAVPQKRKAPAQRRGFFRYGNCVVGYDLTMMLPPRSGVVAAAESSISPILLSYTMAPVAVLQILIRTRSGDPADLPSIMTILKL